MPLNEIPSYLGPETRRLIDLALDEAWQELKNDLPADALLAVSYTHLTLPTNREV